MAGSGPADAIILAVLTYNLAPLVPVKPDRSWQSRRLYVVFALIVFGFGVRAWNLGTQSLWLDEALSVVFARGSLTDVLTILVSQDLHPPLYYVVLHFWMRVAGTSEFAARYLSVAFSLPAIPASYVFCSALLNEGNKRPDASERGQQVGLMATALVTVSPFLVYYAQEARMYSALATFGLLSSLALWRLLQVGGRRWWLAYVVFTSATIYTQYFGGLIVGFQAIYLLGLFLRSRRSAAAGLSALGATAILYVPWAPGGLQQIQRLVTIPDFWKGEFPVSYLLTHVFAAFAIGQFAAMRQSAAIAGVAGVLIVVGLAVLALRSLRRGGDEIFLLAYLIVPLSILYVIVARNPKFAERYLIMIAPPFYMVVALGFVTAWRRISSFRAIRVRRLGLIAVAAVGIGLIGASATQLWQIYYGPTYRKDDNRAAVAYIERNSQPGDVVVLMMNTYQSYQYYAVRNIPWEPLQPGGDTKDAAERLNQIVTGRRRMWLLLWNPEWADPTGFVRQSLDRAYRQEPLTDSFSGLGLRLYDIDPSYRFSVKNVPDRAKVVNFGNKLRLLGYDLDSSSAVAGTAGRITLYWAAMSPLDADYIISLRLKDKQFYWWRHDDRPAAFNFPTMYWQTGQVVTGDIMYQAPPGAPPGAYDLEVGVYAQGQQQDLNVLGAGNVAIGTAAPVATIRVTRPSVPPDVTAIDVPHRQSVGFGSELRLIGEDVVPASTVRGGSVDVSLWWQAGRAPIPDYHTRLTLESGAYTRILADESPDAGTYSTSRWASGELVVDRHRLTIPADAPPGEATISLQIWPPGSTSPIQSDLGSTIALAKTTVLDRQRVTVRPLGIDRPTDWRVGNFARLIGTSLSASQARAGDHLQLTLFWQALANSGTVPYTVFAHLLNHDQKVKAQQDHPPGDGNNPTTGWTNGEYIVDHYDLVISGDAAAGSYDLEVGMYDLGSRQRAPVTNQSGEVVGDRAVVATIEVR